MRNTNEQSVKDVLKEMLETYRLKSRLNETRIRELWTEVMGAVVAGYTTDIKLRRNKLFVSITSAPLRQELNYGRDKIARNMNEALGEELIKEVEVRG
jgi:predicted nucleic acid-binding Zn ribbon protein